MNVKAHILLHLGSINLLCLLVNHLLKPVLDNGLCLFPLLLWTCDIQSIFLSKAHCACPSPWNFWRRSPLLRCILLSKVVYPWSHSLSSFPAPAFRVTHSPDVVNTATKMWCHPHIDFIPSINSRHSRVIVHITQQIYLDGIPPQWIVRAPPITSNEVFPPNRRFVYTHREMVWNP